MNLDVCSEVIEAFSLMFDALSVNCDAVSLLFRRVGIISDKQLLINFSIRANKIKLSFFAAPVVAPLVFRLSVAPVLFLFAFAPLVFLSALSALSAWSSLSSFVVLLLNYFDVKRKKV